MGIKKEEKETSQDLFFKENNESKCSQYLLIGKLYQVSVNRKTIKG